MAGTGPAGGIPVHTGLVICGTDAVSVDTVGAHLLGFQAQGVYYLYNCIKCGLGIGDLKKVSMKGISLAEAEEIFSKAVYGKSFTVDKK